MFDEEHTGEGGILPIAAMDTRYILYAIRYRVRGLHQLLIENSEVVNSRKVALYGVAQLSEAEQIAILKTKIRDYYPLMSEALFRLPEIVEGDGREPPLWDIYIDTKRMLNELLEREGVLVLPESQLHLPPGTTVEEFLAPTAAFYEDPNGVFLSTDFDHDPEF